MLKNTMHVLLILGTVFCSLKTFSCDEQSVNSRIDVSIPIFARSKNAGRDYLQMSDKFNLANPDGLFSVYKEFMPEFVRSYREVTATMLISMENVSQIYPEDCQGEILNKIKAFNNNETIEKKRQQGMLVMLMKTMAKVLVLATHPESYNFYTEMVKPYFTKIELKDILRHTRQGFKMDLRRDAVNYGNNEFAQEIDLINQAK